MKKQDRSEYEPTTTHGILAATDQYMLVRKGKKASTDKQFATVQEVVKSKLKTLKQAGKGN